MASGAGSFNLIDSLLNQSHHLFTHFPQFFRCLRISGWLSWDFSGAIRVVMARFARNGLVQDAKERRLCPIKWTLHDKGGNRFNQSVDKGEYSVFHVPAQLCVNDTYEKVLHNRWDAQQTRVFYLDAKSTQKCQCFPVSWRALYNAKY